LLLAALYANGESVIENSGLIKRGYADIVDKLSHLGASLYEIK
jgi:UDP-N-acetylglucosamine enolpyruvyl transferase